MTIQEQITPQMRELLENQLEEYSNSWDDAWLYSVLQHDILNEMDDIYISLDIAQDGDWKTYLYIYWWVKNLLGKIWHADLLLDSDFTFMGYFDLLEQLDKWNERVKEMQKENDKHFNS